MKSPENDFEVYEMRKSVADVKHTIEEQLIPMINERQHMMDQARLSDEISFSFFSGQPNSGARRERHFGAFSREI